MRSAAKLSVFNAQPAAMGFLNMYRIKDSVRPRKLKVSRGGIEQNIVAPQPFVCSTLVISKKNNSQFNYEGFTICCVSLTIVAI